MGDVTNKYIGYYAMLRIVGKTTKTEAKSSINDVYNSYKDNIIHKQKYNCNKSMLSTCRNLVKANI